MEIWKYGNMGRWKRQIAGQYKMKMPLNLMSTTANTYRDDEIFNPPDEDFLGAL